MPMVSNPPDYMRRLSPHIFYNDVGRALDWLSEAFGFTVEVRMTDQEDFVVHGEVSYKECLILLGLALEKPFWRTPQELNGMISQRLYIYVDDVDAHAEQARRAGAEIVGEPSDQFHGDRAYECRDLEGHHWKFAQHLFDVDMKNLQRPDWAQAKMKEARLSNLAITRPELILPSNP
ncbi:MAG: glyoxalase/bleomycin resistance/extradiol dioxygenase family protein [Symploca sp. SIO3E6]|nr:glyoxalase/bleomycin resistance/extradiol dioxygenase family protein [Caldora sp. SIO3E6]